MDELSGKKFAGVCHIIFFCFLLTDRLCHPTKCSSEIRILKREAARSLTK
jgi:hypothetical protein